MKTLFIKNLAPDTREKDLHELFSRHGTVRAIKLPMDVFNGGCRGIAMIDMEGHEAREAMARLDGANLHGQAIRVQEDRPKKGRKGGRRR